MRRLTKAIGCAMCLTLVAVAIAGLAGCADSEQGKAQDLMQKADTLDSWVNTSERVLVSVTALSMNSSWSAVYCL